MSESGVEMPGAKAPRKRWLPILSLAIAVSLVACGDDSSADQVVTTPPEEADARGTISPATSEPTDPDDEGKSTEDSMPEGGSASGSARITIAGESVEFESFTCFHGEDAIEAFGNDDLTFAAYGEVETSAGKSVVAVSANESPFGPNYTIFYSPTGDSLDEVWQRVGEEAATIDGDRITGDGDFDRIVGGEHTGETAIGSFEATCT
jgi:hypothetical protein